MLLSPISSALNLAQISLWHHLCCAVLTQSCPTLCDPMDCSLPGSSVHKDSPGKNTGLGCHALLWGIFPTQGSDPGLLHCRQILSRLSHQRGPFNHLVDTKSHSVLNGWLHGSLVLAFPMWLLEGSDFTRIEKSLPSASRMVLWTQQIHSRWAWPEILCIRSFRTGFSPWPLISVNSTALFVELRLSDEEHIFVSLAHVISRGCNHTGYAEGGEPECSISCLAWIKSWIELSKSSDEGAL